MNAGIEFYFDALGNAGAIAGPAKQVAQAAGRRGCACWHWSSRDASFNHNAYGSGLGIFRIIYETSSSDVDPVLFRKDTYVDVTVQGWGRRETFSLDDTHTRRTPMEPSPVSD